MTAARQFKTAAEPERALVFVEHIRLQCQVCGIIIQPTDLERTLWADGVCPKCLTVRQEERSAEFNRVLESQAREFESTILRLELSIEATKRMYENLITEGQQLTDKHQWIDKRVIRMIEGFKESDDFDFSELKF